MNEQLPEKPQHPGFFQIIGSVLSAIFGVQSSKNHKRDFTDGNIKYFLGVYVVIAICIILSMITLVRYVISHSTS
jgi:lipopolysaccharide export LptBFGC system permease protein LptF